jgi:hypothetical protein
MPGSREMANPYTIETATGKSFLSDTEGNVSMATKMKDSVFFIVANRRTKEEYMKPQCILRIATYKLDENKLFFRPLFSDDHGEAKYMDVVPPESFEGYLERSFDTDSKGNLQVKETWKMCPLV